MKLLLWIWSKCTRIMLWDAATIYLDTNLPFYCDTTVTLMYIRVTQRGMEFPGSLYAEGLLKSVTRNLHCDKQIKPFAWWTPDWCSGPKDTVKTQRKYPFDNETKSFCSWKCFHCSSEQADQTTCGKGKKTEIINTLKSNILICISVKNRVL